MRKCAFTQLYFAVAHKSIWPNQSLRFVMYLGPLESLLELHPCFIYYSRPVLWELQADPSLRILEHKIYRFLCTSHTC